MSKTPFKKKLLTRFLNDQQHEYLIQKQDIENAVFEQAQSAKQTKHLSTNIQTHQHGSTVDTKGKASHIKHFNYTDQQRQKLIKQYTKQQREDPTVSSLKIVQRITQDLKPLFPSTETPIAPPANLYPALQANHTDTQLLNPFAPSALSITLKNLAIPDFSLSKSLTQNEIILKNEITTQVKLLKYYQKSTTPHSTKILQLLDKILLLKQLQDTLPSFHSDKKTLKTEYINLTKVTLSPASQSQHKSRTPMPDFTPFLQKSLTRSSQHSDKRLCYNPPTQPQPSLHSTCPMQHNQYQTLVDSQPFISQIIHLPDRSRWQTLPKQLHSHSCIPNFSHTQRHKLKPIFRSTIGPTTFIPNMLFHHLKPGEELQWAYATKSTLDKFPFIDTKLKLIAIKYYLLRHPAAKQAAAAQLLQAIQDPLHDPLNEFFTWLFHSYSLSKQELNTNLRKAIEQQKFDWSINPAIALQNAIAKVHMSLNEINNNEIFRETLQEALKVKLHPHYHLVVDTPILHLPENFDTSGKTL